MTRIDEVDQQILKVVQDEPRWKSKIHASIDADRAISSIQQRVDKLEKYGYLTSSFGRVEELPQPVKVYEPTYEGRQVLKENTGDLE